MGLIKCFEFRNTTRGANTISQITTTKKVEYNNLGATGEQTTITITTTIKKQIDSSQQNKKILFYWKRINSFG